MLLRRGRSRLPAERAQQRIWFVLCENAVHLKQYVDLTFCYSCKSKETVVIVSWYGDTRPSIVGSERMGPCPQNKTGPDRKDFICKEKKGSEAITPSPLANSADMQLHTRLDSDDLIPGVMDTRCRDYRGLLARSCALQRHGMHPVPSDRAGRGRNIRKRADHTEEHGLNYSNIVAEQYVRLIRPGAREYEPHGGHLLGLTRMQMSSKCYVCAST